MGKLAETRAGSQQVEIKGKQMTVYEYFQNIKQIKSINKEEKLFLVKSKDGKYSYFPISLCFKALPLEKGLKD